MADSSVNGYSEARGCKQRTPQVQTGVALEHVSVAWKTTGIPIAQVRVALGNVKADREIVDSPYLGLCCGSEHRVMRQVMESGIGPNVWCAASEAHSESDAITHRLSACKHYVGVKHDASNSLY